MRYTSLTVDDGNVKVRYYIVKFAKISLSLG